MVHGTSGLVVKDNVGFHVDGHAVYLEDGVEEDCWIEHNLMAYVHVIGSPASGALQEGTTAYEVGGLAGWMRGCSAQCVSSYAGLQACSVAAAHLGSSV